MTTARPGPHTILGHSDRFPAIFRLFELERVHARHRVARRLLCNLDVDDGVRGRGLLSTIASARHRVT